MYAGADFILNISHISPLFPSVLGCVVSMHTVFSIYIIFILVAPVRVLPIFLSDLRECSNHYVIGWEDFPSLWLLSIVSVPVAFILLHTH